MYRRLLLVTTLFALASHPVFGQKDDSDDVPDPSDEFADLVEDAVLREGLFDTYEADGHLYVAIRPDQLDQDFLFSKEIGRGIGTHGITGGLMMSVFQADVVAFEKHDGKIFLVKRPDEFIAEAGSPQAASLDLTFGSSVVESGEIKATRDDSAVVVDAYDWFVSDLSGVGDRLSTVVSTTPGRPGRVTFDKDRSHLEYVKAFAHNVNVRSKLTFKPGEPVTLSGVPDSRYIPVSIDYALVALPENPMTPRLADDRLGYFMTVKKDFSKSGRSFFTRYVNKWRLECDGPADADGLCDPVRPITYYVDRTVPEAYRQAMLDGVEAYKPAFEAAGFRNAIRSELLPDSADAEDIRYATLRWNVSDQAGWGAIGPSTVDPRTGEVLDADILFEASMVLGWNRDWWNLVDPSASLAAWLDPSPMQMRSLKEGGELSSLGAELASQGALLHTFLTAEGILKPGDPIPDEFVYEVMKWVTMHEVGHTLGLRHNFRSSVDTPLEMLNNKEWIEERGVVSSVMEYPVINLARRGEGTAHYYNLGVGTYDRWVITYGYSPSAERAREVARLAAAPGHAYGTDEDAVGQGAIDPTINVFDLGSDPLEWGKGRAALIKDLWARIPEVALHDNEPYVEATIGFTRLLNQYVNAVGTGVKYIGGQYQHRDHVGDPDGRPPFVPVSKARQKEALAFVVAGAFAEDAFDIPKDVLQSLGAGRWSHWGVANSFNGRIDYPLREQIRGVQQTLLNRITSPFVFARIVDAEFKFGSDEVLGIPELMADLTAAIWSESWSSPGKNTPAVRRDLQRSYIDRLTVILTEAPDRTPADARSVARLTLEDLSDRIGRRLSPPFSFDAYTLAHLKESKARIDRALGAGLDLKN